MRRSWDYDEENDYGFETENSEQRTLLQVEDYIDEYTAFESELIGKIYSEEKWVALMDKYRNGTEIEKKDTTSAIYCAMMPFIKSIAKKFYSSYMPRYTEDLESAGKVGLFNALKDYNPKKGKLTTWSCRFIRHEMRDFIDSEVHHTTPYFQNHLRVIRQYINECQTKGISYTNDDIMIATGMPKQTVTNCILLSERNQNQISMEQYMGENKVSIMDILVSESLDPEQVVIDNESKEYIRSMMKTCLTENELRVIELRYGFFNDETFSNADIAIKLGLQKQDIRPIVNIAERKLCCALQKKRILI